MKIGLIGIGQAGGKIADAFLEYDANSQSQIIIDCVAINTARQDLQGLTHVPQENRLLIGEDKVKGNGVGADNEKGAEVAAADIDEILDAINSIPVHKLDAFLVVAALGGGTGSGGMPVVAKHLKEIYTEPVYGLGVLPSSDEGSIYTLNAARSFQTCIEEVDNLMLFDNDTWNKSGESLSEWYQTVNNEIARRYGVLFSAGEVHDMDEVGESVVDASEIINTLGAGGVSSVGYASEELTEAEQTGGGLLSRFTGSDSSREDETDKTNRITSLVRKATLGRLTLPCDVDSTERGLLVTAGPPDALNRKGIERGRQWLEDETGSMEIRGGDYPLPDSTHVASVVLLSGVHSVPRIKQLQQVAAEASESIEELREEHDAALEELVESEDEDLDPLF